MSIFILAFPIYIFVSDYIEISVKKKHAKLRKKNIWYYFDTCDFYLRNNSWQP